MPTLAATATHHTLNQATLYGVLLLAGIALLLLAGYVIACAVRPFARCRWCRLDNQPTHSRRRVHGPHVGGRHCRWCHDTRLRLRIGRRLWNAITHDYPDDHDSSGGNTEPGKRIVGMPPLGRDR